MIEPLVDQPEPPKNAAHWPSYFARGSESSSRNARCLCSQALSGRSTSKWSGAGYSITSLMVFHLVGLQTVFLYHLSRPLGLACFDSPRFNIGVTPPPRSLTAFNHDTAQGPGTGSPIPGFRDRWVLRPIDAGAASGHYRPFVLHGLRVKNAPKTIGDEATHASMREWNGRKLEVVVDGPKGGITPKFCQRQVVNELAGLVAELHELINDPTKIRCVRGNGLCVAWL